MEKKKEQSAHTSLRPVTALIPKTNPNPAKVTRTVAIPRAFAA